MVVTTLRGRDWINTQEWTKPELDTILDVSLDLKMQFATGQPHELLKGKTIFLLFYNPSNRTRNSFEAGMTQLGGHAHFLSPETMYRPGLEEEKAAGKQLVKETGETIRDTASVLSRYGNAIAIRIFQDPTLWIYGRGNKVVREFAKYATIPVINMEDDVYHPCQAMADLLTVKERFHNLEGKKVALTWAYSPKDRTIGVHHSAALVFSRFGMDVTVAYPEGFEFDDHVIQECKKNVELYGGSFKVEHNFDSALEHADVVMPKSWQSLRFVPPQAQEPRLEAAREYAAKFKDWKCTQEKMDLANKGAVYMHCGPVDRGWEVTDEVVDGPASVVLDQAENRLHAQKAIMALVMGGRP
jgi:ornithine carbamoyltransferase